MQRGGVRRKSARLRRRPLRFGRRESGSGWRFAPGRVSRDQTLCHSEHRLKSVPLTMELEVV